MNLKNAVVVITGASSGIGRATAQHFATHGARLVLAARRGELLQEVAQECIARGGQALVVPTDATQAGQVESLAARAVATFGRIDIWINNAAVLAFGRLEQTPMAVHEQVIQTNLMGYMYGSSAAVRQFRQQKYGILINNISMLSSVSMPYASSYCASKWGIRGLTESIRMEVLDQPAIHICAVLPASVDTPAYEQAANYTGQSVAAPEPVYSAERVAKAIIKLAQNPRREVFAGGFGALAALTRSLAPAWSDRLFNAFINLRLLRRSLVPATAGNVYRAGDDRGATHGNNGILLWDRLERPLTLAAVALPVVIVWLRRRRK